MNDQVKKIVGKTHVNKAITTLINNLVPFETQYEYSHYDEWLVVLRYTDKNGDERTMKVTDAMMVEMVRHSVE